VVSDAVSHWERVYARRDPEELSWHQASPRSSLELIEDAGLERSAAIVDVGGGVSDLAAALLRAGYSDITVADISRTALARAKARLGAESGRIAWVEADVRKHDFGRRFDLWHDRAVLHFMVEAGDRDAYLKTLRRSLRPGGHLILATFGPDGPTACSGLPVDRYSAASLAKALGGEFELLRSRLEEHRTPSDGSQQFLYAHLRRQG
jgi:ubiquinone/menaquinone biosynthesis C-methylase UbiE